LSILAIVFSVITTNGFYDTIYLMRVGAFELDEPVPELNEPHVLAMLDPWVDAGGVGTLTLSWLERHFQAEDIGRIARPGNFFDFTRYRPTIYYDEGGHKQIEVPNTYMTYGRGTNGNDFIFLHLLEPHSHSDLYIDSIVRVLTKLKVKRYCLIGSMYDYVPHTLPLQVTGGASGEQAASEMEIQGIEANNYQGPTSIATLIPQRAPEIGMETMSLIVHIPQYTQLEDDYSGAARLMDVIASIYGVPVDSEYYEKAQQQSEEVNQALNKNPPLQALVKEMEALQGKHPPVNPDTRQPPLAPEIERFLSDMEKRFREGPQQGE
jgi:predicted ATP-grasp superfamily ATP-dependent carboligase